MGQVDRLRVMRVIARMNVGGPAVQVAALMRGIDAGRFEQRLYTGHVGADEADYLDLCAPDVTAHRIPTLGRSVRPADDARALAQLAAAVRQFRPHIVHTHTAKAGALGRVATTLTGVPVRVHTFHGHLLHGYFGGSKRRLLVAAERGLARVTHRLVAVGTRVRDDLLAAGIGRPEQYAVVPPGTELAPLPDRDAARRSLGLTPDDPVVAYVGRVTGVKRPDRFIEAAREVRKALPRAQFLICGDGDLLPETVVSARDLEGSLRPLGWRTDVETVYAAADVVLLTSDNEGMPVSLIEAGMAGIPVVSTQVGSVAEVVQDGVTGLLAPASPGELARLTVRLLHDESLRNRMGRAGRAWTMQRFSPARLVADTHSLYAGSAVRNAWWPPDMMREPSQMSHPPVSGRT